MNKSNNIDNYINKCNKNINYIDNNKFNNNLGNNSVDNKFKIIDGKNRGCLPSSSCFDSNNIEMNFFNNSGVITDNEYEVNSENYLSSDNLNRGM